MAIEAAISTIWAITPKTRFRRRFSATRPAAICAASVVIMHPIARGQERDAGEDGDDDEQDPGQRRGVAHAEIAECLLVEVERIEQRRVDRIAGPARNDEGRRERLEGV